LGVLPPSFKSSWDEMDAMSQAMCIAYSQIREYEEAEAGGS